MLALLIWFLLLSSGSFLTAVIWEKKYEEIFPITCSAIVLLLFVFGIFNRLEMGAGVVLFCGIITYALGIFKLCVRKNAGSFLPSFFSPCFCIFLILSLIIVYCNYGRLAGMWDEFTHWMDIVKVMTTIDAFGTHPEAESMFQSYPPAMALFQYSLENINGLFGDVAFMEWQAYVAYQIFIVAFCLPFFRDFSYKKIGQAALGVLVVLLIPLVFFNNIYASVYIDPILSILTATGLARIFLERKRDMSYHLTILSTCTMLVLMKEAGLLFALFLAVFYLVRSCFEDGERASFWLKNFVLRGFAVLGVPLSVKYLWSAHLKWTRAKIQFSAPVKISDILNLVKGEDSTYRMEVWDNFCYAFSHTEVSLENLQMGISYKNLSVFLFLGLLLLTYVYLRQGSTPAKCIGLMATEVILLSVYVIGLCITYMFKFSEYEAVRLASFERYMNIGYLAGILLLVILTVHLINQSQRLQTFLLVAAFVICLVVIPINKVDNYLHRTAIAKNAENRMQYDALALEIEKFCSKDERIYFIAQETTGIEYWIMRYTIRPVKMNLAFNWSIGSSFYEGDVYTVKRTREEWRDDLMANYDYVALYKLNDYFYEHYGELFEDEKEIVPNSLYKINKQSGLLERCEL